MTLTLRQRRIALALATWAVAVVAFFWAVPPPNRLAAVLAALLSLMVLPVMRWSRRKRVLLSLIVSLALSVAAVVAFHWVRDTRTLTGGGRLHYVGTELTAVAREYLDNHPEETQRQLLENAAWDETFVWTEASLRTSRLLVLTSYLLCLPLLAASLLAAVQLGTSYVVSPLAAASAERNRGQRRQEGSAPRGDGRIFFSYSRQDSEFCLQLAQDLKQHGLDAWIDQLDIPAGAQWDSAVEDALKRAATVLVVLSPDSVGSQNVLDEVGLAIDGGARVVPILHRSCELPLRLRRLQYVDCSNDYDEGLELLLAKLA